MIAEDGGFIHCDGPECDRKIKNDRWSKIKADGWFFMKDGTAYCPQHWPDWVKRWVERNR